jgi:hypothetical protein
MEVRSIGWGLVELAQGMEAVQKSELDAFAALSRAHQQRRSLWEQRTAELLREEGSSLSRESRWGLVASIAQFVSSAASCALGMAAFSRGHLALGASLISAGALGIGSRLAADLALWQKAASLFTQSAAEQNRLARQLELSAWALSSGVSLVSGCMALYSGAFAQLALNDAIRGAEYASTAASIIAQIGIQKARQDSLTARSCLKREVEGPKTLGNQALKRGADLLSDRIAAQRGVCQAVAEAVRNLTVHGA